MLRYVMLWRHVIAQIAVFLCGGLTGPIFLAIYFLSGEEDELAWMLWVGAALTVGSVLVGVVVGHFIGRGVAKLEQYRQRRDHLRQRGVLALAEVTGYAETGTWINERPVVKVDLHVEGQGLAPFDTQTRTTVGVTAMPVLAGRRVVVLVDPATHDCEIDLQASALVSGVMPMRLTSAEDNTTYDITGQAGPVMEILQVLRSNGIPLGGSFDFRSNPVVHQQVQEILQRNTAAQQAPRPGVQPFAPAAASFEPSPGVGSALATAAIGGTAVAGTGDAAGDRGDHGVRVRCQAQAGYRRPMTRARPGQRRRCAPRRPIREIDESPGMGTHSAAVVTGMAKATVIAACGPGRGQHQSQPVRAAATGSAGAGASSPSRTPSSMRFTAAIISGAAAASPFLSTSAISSGSTPARVSTAAGSAS
jgi:hypothetical protein